MHDFFKLLEPADAPTEIIAEGATLLRGAALPFEKEVLTALKDITAKSPFRHMVTSGGYTMTVAMTNCGDAGWITDRTGYRYDQIDPETASSWPAMPGCFVDLAVAAAKGAGYPEFRPDACLINRYEPRARLSLHQDKNEKDFANPIVSVSLGLPVTFQFGGRRRKETYKDVRAQARGCRRLGRSVTPLLPRGREAQGRQPRIHGARAHQSDIPPCALAVEFLPIRKQKIGVCCARTCEQLPATPPFVEFETRAKRLTRRVVSATPGPNSPVAEADLAKAFVLACIGKLVANGFAEWTVLETGDVGLTFNAGETFLLADTSIIRIS